MAELLRIESSGMCGRRHDPRCVWSFFHIFTSYQRREPRRLLSYRGRTGDMQHHYSAGADIHIKTDVAGRNDVVGDKETNIIVEQGNRMNRSSGKARILNFITKKLLKRHKHKVGLSHSSSQLKRSISIHHSKSDFNEMTSDSETSSAVELCLDDIDSPAINEHGSSIINGLHGLVDGKLRTLGSLNTGTDIGCRVRKLDEVGNQLLGEQLILKEKLFEARDALLKQKDTDPKGTTVEFSLRSKIFLDTLQLFNTNREALYNVCNGEISFLADSMQGLGLNKSLSNPSEISGNAGVLIPSSKKIENDSFIYQKPMPELADLPTNTFRVVPDIEVMHVCDELRKQRERKTVLSRLRGLKQRIKGVIAENRRERHRISMDGILHKLPSGRKLVGDEENHKLPEKVGSTSKRFKFDRAALDSSIRGTAPHSFQRSVSLAESLEKYSLLLDSISANDLRKAPERSKSNRECSTLLQPKLLKNHGRMVSNPEFLRSYSYSKDAQRGVNLEFQSAKNLTGSGSDDKLNRNLIILPAEETNACEQEGLMESSIMGKEVKPAVSNNISAHTVEISTTETKGCQREPRSTNILEEKSGWLNEQENPIEDQPNLMPENPSPISAVDSDMEEESISPLKFTAPAGSELQLLPDDEANCLPVHADEKDIARFTYVKHILSKSGYDALCFETHDSPYEVSTGNHMLCDMPFEEQLIYDLIHEVIFEIYEHSTAPSPWLPHFRSKIRSMPTGSYLLDEVWAEIRRHLGSPEGFSTIVDDVFEQNFGKRDGWMNLYCDAECYGLLLEQLILDDLVDEIILGSVGL
ncbi:hypothetical protein KSP40_PGU007187 [Platanthera guangdongensis]|uniref:DUF4378 domain-containing protein n=1 Tax=Platanthera guangdongensis TaxID=2320717 RepID=A0ABR2LVR1_9ASPA